MLSHQQTFDTNEELILQPYRQGVRLVRPNQRVDQVGQSISSFYQLPIASYFIDSSNRIVSANEVTAEVVGMQSVNDTLGKSNAEFCSKEFSAKLIADEDSVFELKQMKVVEDSGSMIDGSLVQAISFLIPWYSENQVIGLLGCSIMADATSAKDFAVTLSQLIATGILNPGQPLALTNMINSQNDPVYFSKREKDVLSLLVRGKTAREIGTRLDISRRTVEHHIASMKLKTKSTSKYELIDKFIG